MAKRGEVSLDHFFRALADPTRLRLLNLIGGREICVCFFVEILGMSQPKISRAAFDRLSDSGMIGCTACGSTDVTKSLMAPAVKHATEDPARPLATPTNKLEEALAALRREVEENSEYVGPGFAAEARAIHEGAAPERAIWGEALGEEARQLIEDGVPVAPLPFRPRSKSN
jgi:hypothetical protein